MSPQTPPLPSVMLFNNEEAEEALGKATLFNKFIGSVFNFSWQIIKLEESPPSAFSRMSVTENQILNCLNALRIRKARGPDNVGNVFLKSATVLSKFLLLPYQRCLNEGEFPTAWKAIEVVPLNKDGNRRQIENYRPINILTNVSKIFERIVFDDLYEFVSSNWLTPNSVSAKIGLP